MTMEAFNPVPPPEIYNSVKTADYSVVKRPRATPESFQIKLDWMKQALGEGAHLVVPKNRAGPKMTDERWGQIVDIGLLYTYTYLSLEDLGSGDVAVNNGWPSQTRANISLLNEQFITHLWNNCSPELQEKYPLSDIPFDKLNKHNKPWTQTSRVRDQIKKGITDPQVISKIIDIPVAHVQNAKSNLRAWGEEIPRTTSYKKLKLQIEEENDDAKLQELLNSLSPISIRGFVDHHKGDLSLPFMSLGNVAWGLGFSFKGLNDFVEILRNEKNHIPIRGCEIRKPKENRYKYAQIYWIFFAKHIDRVRDALSNSEKLKSYRKTDLPNDPPPPPPTA